MVHPRNNCSRRKQNYSKPYHNPTSIVLVFSCHYMGNETNCEQVLPNSYFLAGSANSFERKDLERELLAKLLVYLCTAQEHLLSQRQLLQGYGPYILYITELFSIVGDLVPMFCFQQPIDQCSVFPERNFIFLLLPCLCISIGSSRKLPCQHIFG